MSNSIQDLLNSNQQDSILSGLSYSDAAVLNMLTDLFGNTLIFKSIAPTSLGEDTLQLQDFHPYTITLGIGKLPAPFDFINGSTSTISIAFGISIHSDGSKSAGVFGVSGEIKIHDFDFKFEYSNNYFSAQITEANPPSLSNLLQCIIPTKIDIPIADDIAISEVDFYINFNSAPTSFGFKIKSQGSINVFGGSDSIVLEDPSLSVIFLGSKLSSLKIGSKWDIEQTYVFDLNLSHEMDMGTDFTLIYNSDESSDKALSISSIAPSIPDLNGAILSDVLSEFNSIVITDLMLHGNLSSKIIGAKVAGSWTPKDTTIKKVLNGTVNVYAEFSHDGINKLTTYTMGSVISDTIGTDTIDLGISMTNSGDGNGNSYSIFGKNLKIGVAIEAVSNQLGKLIDGETFTMPSEITNALSSITIDSFDLSYQSGSTTFSIKIKSGLTLKQFLKDLTIKINIKNFNPTINELEFDYAKTKISDTESTHSYTLSAWLSNNPSEATPDYLFKISKATSTSGTHIFTGTIFNLGGGTIKLSALKGLDINDLFFAHIVISKKSKINVFGSDISLSANVDLSKMKVVGHFFSEARVAFDAFRVVYCNSAVDADSLTLLNSMLQSSNISPLTNPKSSGNNNSGNLLGLDQGLTVQGNIVLNDYTIPLYSEAGSAPLPTPAAKGVGASPAIPDNNTQPTPVGKKFGPVTFTSISIGLKSSKIHVIINGNIHIGPVEVDFINFTIDTPIPTKSSPWPDPTFDIEGLGLKLVKPPLNLAGEFLKDDLYYHSDNSINTTGPQTPNTEPTGYPIPFTQYAGGLSIGIKKIQIVAIGAYAKIGGPIDMTTMFIYGALSVPIALPPIALLESVALGFGMNRNVVLPAPEQIDNHPLVGPLMGNLPDFQTMNNTILIEKGENWFALGVRLLVLEMADVLILLIVKFGNKLEIDILGRAAFTLPKTKEGAPSLCNLIIGVVAEIIPEEGVVSVLGGFLKGSYIYCPDVQVSGGFGILHISNGDRTGTQYADATEGEFVLTIGGYSPFYTPKTYYPSVPRLALTWKVSDHMNVSAQAYCAIVPNAFMVGGKLSADFSEGGDFAISVHFEVGADFIVWFKPYHYKGDAYMSLAISASINIHLLFIHIHQSVEIDAHADVTFWGPDFAGHADVSVHFIVTFSASVNFGPALAPPPPLSLNEFLHSFFKIQYHENLLTVELDANKNAILDSNGLQIPLLDASKKEQYILDASGEKIQVTDAEKNKIPKVDSAGNYTLSEKNMSLQVTKGLLSHQPFIINSTTSKKERSLYTNSTSPITLVNPKEIEIHLSTPIPVKEIDVNGSSISSHVTSPDNLGISAMGNDNSNFSKSTFNVTITNSKGVDLTSEEMAQLSFTPLYHNFPAGMWKAADSAGIMTIPSSLSSDTRESLLTLCSGVEVCASPVKSLGNGVDVPKVKFDIISIPVFNLNTDTFCYN